MFLIRFLARTAVATSLVYRIAVTSLIIAGLAVEAHKHFKRKVIEYDPRA